MEGGSGALARQPGRFEARQVRAHWRGQVAGKAMPPNAVVISEADARRLVRWILAL